jgi:hypothetical protein
VKAAAGPAIHIPIKVTDTIRKPAARQRHLKRLCTVGSKGQHVLQLDRTFAGVQESVTGGAALGGVLQAKGLHV